MQGLSYLAADIGGTKSLAAVVSLSAAGDWEYVFRKRYANSEYASPEQMLQACITDAGITASDLASMSLAVAGPVNEGVCELTNLDWRVDTSQLEAAFDLDQVMLINDFRAVAEGVSLLEETDTVAINTTAPAATGISVVTGAGTGLGLAWKSCTQTTCSVHATEGGHCGFSPADEEQQQLLAMLSATHGHVSWETLLSGDGLERIYRFCAQQAGTQSADYTAGQITRAAHDEEPLALQTMALFWRLYANWVGNLALLYRPQAGIYLAGGVTIHALPWLDKAAFLAASQRKGAMEKLVEETPVRVITDEAIGLLGTVAVMNKNLSREM